MGWRRSGMSGSEIRRPFVTFRSDPALRLAIEAAASREGVSVSKWIVAKLRVALSGGAPSCDARPLETSCEGHEP